MPKEIFEVVRAVYFIHRREDNMEELRDHYC